MAAVTYSTVMKWLDAALHAAVQGPLDKSLSFLDDILSFIGPGSISYLTGLALKHAGYLYRLLLKVPVLRFALLASQWGLTQYYLLFVVESYWGAASQIIFCISKYPLLMSMPCDLMPLKTFVPMCRQPATSRHTQKQALRLTEHICCAVSRLSQTLNNGRDTNGGVANGNHLAHGVKVQGIPSILAQLLITRVDFLLRFICSMLYGDHLTAHLALG